MNYIQNLSQDTKAGWAWHATICKLKETVLFYLSYQKSLVFFISLLSGVRKQSFYTSILFSQNQIGIAVLKQYVMHCVASKPLS